MQNPSELKKRFEAVKGFVAISDLIIICTNLPDKADKCNKWIEKIAAIVNKKRVPKDWNDKDVGIISNVTLQGGISYDDIRSTIPWNTPLSMMNSPYLFGQGGLLTEIDIPKGWNGVVFSNDSSIATDIANNPEFTGAVGNKWRRDLKIKNLT